MSIILNSSTYAVSSNSFAVVTAVMGVLASVIEEQRLKGKGVNFLVSAAAVDDVVDLILL